MRLTGHRWRGTGLAIALVVFNTLFVIRLMGLSYGRFTWEAWAQVYGPVPGPDTDGDGIIDPVDPRPNQFDPSGCFYDRQTGRIMQGGLITPSGPGNLTVGLDGSNGCYQVTTDTAGTLTLAITRLPTLCRLDTTCPNLGTLVVNGVMDLGFPEDVSHPGFLVGGGKCTPYYLALEYSDPGDTVITNNIPLICEQPAPVLSGWMWYVLVLGLMLAGGFSLRRQRAAGEM